MTKSDGAKKEGKKTRFKTINIYFIDYYKRDYNVMYL